MISWENPPYHNDEEYEKLCEESKPSDFYFVAKIDDGTYSFVSVMIAIVPKVYFHFHKCMWDQSMFLEHILPDDFCESMESVWDSERALDEVKDDLLTRGFEENDEFTKLVNEEYN